MRERDTTLPDAMVLFHRFEYALAGTKVREDARVRPIGFIMLEGDGDSWVFDPTSSDRLFRQGRVDAALTITCRPTTLLKLFEPGAFAIDHTEPLLTRGDLGALDPIIDALSTAYAKKLFNALSLRCAARQ